MPVIPVYGKLRQVKQELKASLGYTAKSYVKATTKKWLYNVIILYNQYIVWALFLLSA